MTMRNKYEQRKILLASEMTRETAIQLLRNAPIDPVKPIEVVIREQVKARSNDANSYYWLVLNQISEQGWINGKSYSSECWHEYAKRNLMSDIVVTKDGVSRSKWEECPDGSMSVISTTQLEKSCFADYITTLEAWASREIGVKFSTNRKEIW